jgi:hypothetical protein
MPFEALAETLERQPPNLRPVYAIIDTVSGFFGPRIVTALSDSTIMQLDVPEGWLPNNATRGLSFGCVCANSDLNGYSAEFVASILQADAAKPEAKFDNVVDMLDWLNRD